MNEKKIGFIGTGQMATALAGGFAKKLQSIRLFGYDIKKEATEHFVSQTNATLCESATQVVLESDIVVFSVKPQQMNAVLQSIKETVLSVVSERFFMTIAAGLPISYYEKALTPAIHLARVMPNTPCLIGEAASGFSLSTHATRQEGQMAQELLNLVGLAYEVPEHLLNAVTGLSGSGPAFVFMILEALADGGVQMGLPRNIALELAAQTLKGSAELFLKTQLHPGVLKDRVCSPAGTTIAGVAQLEKFGVRSAMIHAVEAAAKRSAELS